jgi:hypothetical protein
VTIKTDEIRSTEFIGHPGSEYFAQRSRGEQKAALLRHYKQKEPTRFVQIDGFSAEQCDDVVRDIGGFALMTGETHELMSGGPRVRVLIVPGTPAEVVQKILEGAIEFYGRGPCPDCGEVYGRYELG